MDVVSNYHFIALFGVAVALTMVDDVESLLFLLTAGFDIVAPLLGVLCYRRSVIRIS